MLCVHKQRLSPVTDYRTLHTAHRPGEELSKVSCSRLDIAEDHTHTYAHACVHTHTRTHTHTHTHTSVSGCSLSPSSTLFPLSPSLTSPHPHLFISNLSPSFLSSSPLPLPSSFSLFFSPSPFGPIYVPPLTAFSLVSPSSGGFTARGWYRIT